MTRSYADVLICIGLFFAAVETGLFHLSGPPTGAVFLSHFGLIVMALVMLGLRVYQGRQPTSVTRALLIAGGIVAVAAILFTDGQFQRSGSGGEAQAAAAVAAED
jgi:hypothetical protein